MNEKHKKATKWRDSLLLQSTDDDAVCAVKFNMSFVYVCFLLK